MGMTMNQLAEEVRTQLGRAGHNPGMVASLEWVLDLIEKNRGRHATPRQRLYSAVHYAVEAEGVELDEVQDDLHDAIDEVVQAVEWRLEGRSGQEDGGDPGDEEAVLAAARKSAADDAFADYDFGDDPVEDSGGWEIDGDEHRSVVFLGGPPHGPTTRHKFVVRFRPGSADVDEAYVAE